MGYEYNGFWKSMDTFKEKQELDDLHSKKCSLATVEEERKGSGHSLCECCDQGRAGSPAKIICCASGFEGRNGCFEF